MLPVLLIIAAVFLVPAVIALAVRGEPDNAVRHDQDPSRREGDG